MKKKDFHVNGYSVDANNGRLLIKKEEAKASKDEPVTIKIANYALLESGYTEYWESIEKKI